MGQREAAAAHWSPPQAIRHHKVRTQHHAPHCDPAPQRMPRPRATATSPRRTYCGILASLYSAAVRAPAPPHPHLRCRSLQAASSRPSTTTPNPPLRALIALPRRFATTTLLHKVRAKHHAPHSDPAPKRMPRPRAAANEPTPHVLLRWSSVRLGGSARASASTPASPMSLAASREQPTLNRDPNPPLRALVALPRRSATTRSEPSTTHHIPTPHCSACPDREPQQASPRRTYR